MTSPANGYKTDLGLADLTVKADDVFMDQRGIPTFHQLSGFQSARVDDAELLGPTVLIADASSLFRRNLEPMLQREGYRILHAETGVEAITLCAKERPDLVILEGELPGINGIAACQAMKERLGRDDLYVLLTLGQEREDAYRAAKTVGADRVLYKPIEIDPLVKTIRSMLLPMPLVNQPLMVTALDSRRACHVTSWRPRARGISLDPGPEFDWLGSNLQAGIKVHVSYVAEDGARIVRAAVLRQVWKQLNQKALEVSFTGELQRLRATEFIPQPMALQIKYASPEGDYCTAKLVNISSGGMRLADLRDPLELGSTVPLFIIQDSEVLFALSGSVSNGRIQADGRFEGQFTLVGMSAETERRLSRTLFGA